MTLAFEKHNHSHCISTSLKDVESVCAQKSLRLTPVRRRVLEILLESHKALGAYDILARLSEEGLGSQPPIAYRALDFLVSNGFAHKLQRLNAFVACGDPDCNANPVFLICSKCNRVAEADFGEGRDILANAAHESGFEVERTVIEAEGTCPRCATSAQ